jgi:hypothetical protein
VCVSLKFKVVLIVVAAPLPNSGKMSQLIRCDDLVDSDCVVEPALGSGYFTRDSERAEC